MEKKKDRCKNYIVSALFAVIYNNYFFCIYYFPTYKYNDSDQAN